MKAVVSLDEFRKNLADIVASVMYGDQTVVVQKHNKNGVVVISQREYENLKDPRKRFSSREDWDQFFNFTDKIRARLSAKDQTNFANILDEEIRSVRSEKNHDKV